MSIFSRTRDIFAANITEMLDRSEDPAKMIRMVILEMEETLVDVRASAARCIADRKEMGRALSRLDELQRNWTEKAELALSKEREDLAKAALIERQKATDMADGLNAEIKVIDDTLRVELPGGPSWHRYTRDGYGEHDDGTPFVERDGGTRGRGWPLLTGERAHFELASGRPEEAARLLDAASVGRSVTDAAGRGNVRL